MNRDNTVSFHNLTLQIEPVRWRGTLAGCTVIVHHYDERGCPTLNPKLAAGKAVEKTRAGKVQKPTFPPRLEIPPSARDSHFPTAPTAAGG